MSDSNMDPCECIWSHEMAMRRLLNLLRQSQSYCTDTECFNSPDGNLLLGQQRDLPDNSFLFLSLMVAFVIFIAMNLRPRLASRGDSKPRNNDLGSNGGPPLPPSTL